MRIRPNIRRVRPDQDSVLVSGKSARVASRGIEREGMPPDVIAKINEAFKQENKGKRKSVPDRLYRQARTRPLLLVHVIEARTDAADQDAPDILVALGLSFPQFNDTDVAKRVKYRVNLVEWKAIVENEADDDAGDETENDEG